MSARSEESEDGEEFEVEAIVGHKDSTRYGRKYKVKWNGFSKKTFEPRANLVPNSLVLVKAYDKKHPIKKQFLKKHKSNKEKEQAREREKKVKSKSNSRSNEKVRGRSSSRLRSKDKIRERSKSRQRSKEKDKDPSKSKSKSNEKKKQSKKNTKKSEESESKESMEEWTDSDVENEPPNQKKQKKLAKKAPKRHKRRSRSRSRASKPKSELPTKTVKAEPRTTLSKTKKLKRDKRSSSRSSRTGRKATSNPENEYDVDILLKHRDYEHGREYLVKWQGYRRTEATWEPVKNLSCRSLVRQYEHLKGKWKMPRKRRKRSEEHHPLKRVRPNYHRSEHEFEEKEISKKPARMYRGKDGKWTKKNEDCVDEENEGDKQGKTVDGDNMNAKREDRSKKKKYAKMEKKEAGIVKKSGSEEETVDEDDELDKKGTNESRKKGKLEKIVTSEVKEENTPIREKDNEYKEGRVIGDDKDEKQKVQHMKEKHTKTKKKEAGFVLISGSEEETVDEDEEMEKKVTNESRNQGKRKKMFKEKKTSRRKKESEGEEVKEERKKKLKYKKKGDRKGEANKSKDKPQRSNME